MKVLFNIDKNIGSDYLYRHIYKEIKAMILERKLKSNKKLPSKRMLAEQLGVSVNTVTNAYDQLIAEGYIYTIERKGYFVENITHFIHQNKKIGEGLPDDLKEEYVSKDGWITLSHMTANISLFPFKEWIKCQQKAVFNHKADLAEINHQQGPYILRETISRMIALNRGVICEPEQIVMSAGTQPLIHQLMSMQNKHTIVAIEDPGYPRFNTLLSRMKLSVQPIQLDNKGINIKKVESSNADFLFVTPSHQFPTGKIMPISRRIELLNWSAKSKNRFIVEDDYDSEFKYKTDSIPSLQSLDRNQRVIYTGTFSKSLLPSFRMSYMVLPFDILRKYREHYSDLMPYNSTLTLLTLHYFIENGAYARHIKRMTHHYETKRNYLIEQLHDRFKNKITIKDIPAGLHFFAEFKTDKGYEEIEESAREKRLEIYSMRRFMLKNKNTKKHAIELIIGFANINKEQIPEAVDRLYNIIK